MKLVVAIVQAKDVDNLLSELSRRRIGSTQINSAGGFLRESNVTLLLGVDDDSVDEVYRLIRQNCHARTQYVNPLLPIIEPGELYMPDPVEVQVGGAAVFVLGIARLVHL